MNYIVNITEFEGPLDLLLHLIKQNDIDIFEISIEQIADQYLTYISEMEQMNLDIASEYLVMAAELIEIKSSVLLPNYCDNDDNTEEDVRQQLINKLILYKQYKEVTSQLKELEEKRMMSYSKRASNLEQYKTTMPQVEDMSVDVDKLIEAFDNFLKRLEYEKPINTKVTKKEYSVSDRNNQIKEILKKHQKVEFLDLFNEYNKEYIIVTFLSILELSKKQYLQIIQEHNFQKIYLTLKER